MARRVRKTILGKKLGMSQLFDDSGNWIPVTLIEAGPCTVLQVKNVDTDGYEALQVGFDGTEKEPGKPRAGLFEKVDTAPKRVVREIPVFEGEELEAGQDFNLSLFEGVEMVDVQGVSKGKGFAGTVKRWNHHIGPKGHGSKSKRSIGSTGMMQDPGRVIKGKKMPGQLGNAKVKVRNLKVVSTDAEQNLLVVKGAVPGATGAYLTVEESL
ncbi:MAG: 50S ribosomal protein L3 [Planctomycetota bacterium]|nr:50S ribosomal protein L3 [Planctomycetota bacterium]